MNVKIEIIPHDQHRYPTVGDWFFEGEDLVIRVSKLSDWRLEMLIAIHELAEVLICKHRGITTESVDAFDIEFEKQRKLGLECSPDDAETARLESAEPGDEPTAPYHREHCIATGIERIMAAELDVSWREYEEELSNLP